MRTRAVAALLLVGTALAGCIGSTDDLEPSGGTDADLATWLDGVQWDTEGPYSRVLEDGTLDVLPVEQLAIASFDGTEIAAGLWLPDVPDGTKVPVILMISPYWSAGLYVEDLRTETFFLESFVSHGYAFAKVASRGTSFSGGCMGTFSLEEQQDYHEVVEYFGTQPWSNGNVSIIGLSYVGTTPWGAASFGSEHLRTIVPISGVTSWFHLGFRNGSAEPRTPIHMPLYWAQYGVGLQALETMQGDDPAHLLDNVCPTPFEGIAASYYSILMGDPGPGPFAQYWADRDLRQRVIDNYDGSVLVVQGLQDWNVNSDMVFPFVNQLQANGTEVKMLLGQWTHSWPDSANSRDEHLRWDFAEVLLRWFDHYLKGTGEPTGPWVDVEDGTGAWRTETRWPPTDRAWTPFHLGEGTLEAEPTAAGIGVAINPAGAIDPPDCNQVAGFPLQEDLPITAWTFTTEALAEDLRVAGLPRVHVTVVPGDARGGQVYAELWDVAPDADARRVAHGAMNLRFHEGGHEPQTIVPGEPVLAKLELYPVDDVVVEGHRLMLRIVPDGSIEPCGVMTGDDLIHRPTLPSLSPVPMQLQWGDETSVLHLPVIERDVGEGRYPGQPT